MNPSVFLILYRLLKVFFTKYIISGIKGQKEKNRTMYDTKNFNNERKKREKKMVVSYYVVIK